MTRLRIQCLFASVAMHGLLLVLFVAGSGFLVQHQEPTYVEIPLLDFVPARLVDQAVMGGGDPQGGAPSTPAPPAKPVTPPARSDPQKAPPATPPKTVRPAPPTTPPKTTPKSKIEVSKNLVTRTFQDDTAARRKAAQRAEAEAAAEAERARQIRSSRLMGAVSRLQGNLSGRSVVAVPYGPGGGGETYAGYGLYVRLVYERAWRPPVEVPDGSHVVTARVVIARDGRVISADIVQRSNIRGLDRSVAAALDRVTSIGRPFPENSKDERKTFLIDFDLQARQGMG